MPNLSQYTPDQNVMIEDNLNRAERIFNGKGYIPLYPFNNRTPYICYSRHGWTISVDLLAGKAIVEGKRMTFEQVDEATEQPKPVPQYKQGKLNEF